MKFKIQLVAVSEAGQEETVKEIAVLDKNDQRIEHLGLTLAESKEILKQLQKNIVAEQATSFLDAYRCCRDCGRKLATRARPSVRQVANWLYR